ncbi:MAG: hypothetical protein IAG13_10900 [Deltaproteobacteria bacterium]|nr:hypothetical protein [Nannocystaceae bacterium]
MVPGLGSGVGRLGVASALVLAACGESQSTIRGEIQLDRSVDPNQFVTLEIRAVPYDPDEPDARARPDEPPPFSESVVLVDTEFPYEFEMVEDAFHDWHKGWAVAWLTYREGGGWVLATEPFGAIRIDLVAPAPALAPQTDDADLVIRTPD